jgi:hypothetical protein
VKTSGLGKPRPTTLHSELYKEFELHVFFGPLRLVVYPKTQVLSCNVFVVYIHPKSDSI